MLNYSLTYFSKYVLSHSFIVSFKFDICLIVFSQIILANIDYFSHNLNRLEPQSLLLREYYVDDMPKHIFIY